MYKQVLTLFAIMCWSFVVTIRITKSTMYTCVYVLTIVRTFGVCLVTYGANLFTTSTAVATVFNFQYSFVDT